jgi:hypothetical protein
MKVIIVGGVAGGASAPVGRNVEILMVQRGPYVWYANCGLPHHLSGDSQGIEPAGGE